MTTGAQAHADGKPCSIERPEPAEKNADIAGVRLETAMDESSMKAGTWTAPGHFRTPKIRNVPHARYPDVQTYSENGLVSL